MPRRQVDLRWGDAERVRLGLAIDLAGHGQEGCIAELVAVHRVPAVTQATVSRWISAGIKTPDCIDALLAYTETYASAVGIRIPLDVDEQDDREHRSGDDPDVGTTVPVELARVQSRLRAERRRSARLAREIERLGGELALALEQQTERARVPPCL